jgi:hypothetical protein
LFPIFDQNIFKNYNIVSRFFDVFVFFGVAARGVGEGRDVSACGVVTVVAVQRHVDADGAIVQVPGSFKKFERSVTFAGFFSY